MERTLPAGRLGRRRARSVRGRFSAPAPARAAWRLGATILALLVRGVVALAAAARRHPRRAGALVGLLAVLGLAWFVVRSSPLSAVRRVEVHGVSGMDAGPIGSALVAAAKRQSTLGVDVGALRAAVARYHLVSRLQVSASFPHTLRITVTEQLPVATLRDGSERAVVASDGVVLDPRVVAGAAPTIDVPSLPSGHVTDLQLRSELAVLGAAPPVLLHRVARIYTSPNGLTVLMRNGLLIFFGDSARPHAKWLSAARVIASPLAAGATYVDVRVPDRPAAGGLSTTASSTGSTGTTDTTDATIAAALLDAEGSGTSAAPTPSGTAATGSTTADGGATPGAGAAGGTPATATGGSLDGAATGASATTSGGADGAATGTGGDTGSASDGASTSGPAESSSGASAATGTGYTSTGG